MKTYVLTVSRVFPCTHKRKGDQTYFPEKLITGIVMSGKMEFGWNHLHMNFEMSHDSKIHTIRSNYELWSKRIEQIQKGEAILSIRYWSGKPYNSKQVEICQLDKDSGIGVQSLFFLSGEIFDPIIEGDDIHGLVELSQNDGLSLEDFKEWFSKNDLSKEMAIIHFTKFRY